MVKYNGDVEEYKFHNFTDIDVNPNEVKTFEFKPLSDVSRALEGRDFQHIIRQERENAKVSNFKINPITEKYRGLKDQEEREFSELIEQEVAKK